MNALETKNLKKSFGSLVVADDVSLTLPQGGRHALIGPNGAGKTTLINLITGMLKPDSGDVFLDGSDVTDAHPSARVKSGLVRTFQINTLFPKITPLESATMAICEQSGHSGIWLKPLSKRTAEIEKAFDLLTKMGLADDATRVTSDLAYGQQRLLEIALALASEPKVLLLDEPAAGVPKSESAALFQVIADLPKEISVLFIEHDMDLVFTFASHITVLVQGAILVEGTSEDIAKDPLVREVYLGGAHV